MLTLLELPAEIRALIYGAVVPKRIISIIRRTNQAGCIAQLHGRLLPPVVFQVCQQMREESMRDYGKCQIVTACCSGHSYLRGSRLDEGVRHSAKEQTYVYISYIHDTIYFPEVFFILDPPSIPDLDLTRIRSLAIPFWEQAPKEWYINIGRVCAGLKLNKLLFVVSNSGNPTHNFVLRICDLELEYDVKRHLSEVKPRIFETISLHLSQNYCLRSPYPDVTGSLTLAEEHFRSDNLMVKNNKPVLPWSLARAEFDEPELARKCTVFVARDDT